MPNVTCPSCGEKGKIPATFIGTRIKCKKCGIGFMVGPATAKPGADGGAKPEGAHAATASAIAAAPVVKVGAGDEIEVEGLDASAWETTTVAVEPAAETHVEHHDEATAAFAAHPEGPITPGAVRQYKFLSSKDKFFESSRYDIETIEQALNAYARQGWVARGITSAHVTIRGIDKEQLVILLER